MKILYVLICLPILGYLLYNKKKKSLRDSGMTGRILTRTFSVSLNYPLDEFKTVEFISINEDGSATIKTLFSGEHLTAKLSKYFKGKDFGSFGLRLIAVSIERQEIQLIQTKPEYLG